VQDSAPTDRQPHPIGMKPSVCGRIPACAWPAIPSDVGAQSLALLYQLQQSEWLTPEVVHAAQFRQLQQLFTAAVQALPFWRERLEAAGYQASKPADAALLRRVPVLPRADVQQLGESLWNRSFGNVHGGIHEGQTSGSTGMPVKYLQTDLTRLFWRVLTLREHLWQGRDFSGKLAAIRSNVERGEAPTWGVATAQVFETGPAVSLNIRADVASQLDWLVTEAPQYLLTHPSNLRSLLRLAVARGVRLPGLLQVRTFGEMLPAETVARCREVWGVGIADIYSAEEIGVIAFQCERGRYHVQSENLLLEILDECDAPLPAGHVGRVVITTLHNLAMPLIRYELGDYAAFGEACPCGRGLPVLERIVGRRRNMLRLPDGTEHWPSFPEERWAGIAPIRQLQAVQTAIDQVRLRVVASRSLTSAETRQLQETFAGMLGFPHTIVVDEVAEIPRQANAKFEDFVSQLE
jgi:phenylacetate-CoA ligase